MELEETPESNEPRKTSDRLLALMGTTIAGWEVLHVWPTTLIGSGQVKARMRCPICQRVSIQDLRIFTTAKVPKGCSTCCGVRKSSELTRSALRQKLAEDRREMKRQVMT